MEEWLVVLITVAGTFLASSGFWGYIQYRQANNDAVSKLVLGIGYYTIQEECIRHLHAGSITREEYNEIHRYLYEPYTDLGGNGTAKKMMADVSQLPIRQPPLRTRLAEPPKEL